MQGQAPPPLGGSLRVRPAAARPASPIERSFLEAFSMMKISASIAILPLVGLACGGGLPAAAGGGTRESGQSKLMDDTFAGKNKCSAANHDRPFIIEWDATDMSSFESYAANDVVVVHFEGCNLQVLDKCRNDSMRGSLGAYKAVEWTSGSLEKIQIADEGELYAKLPLGVASLGGRVHAGEKFQMEYYVAGTRTATRDSVYATELSKLPGCEGATHFVYAYNLGAFALGSVSELTASADASLYGFGAGGTKKSSHKADKQGGDLGKCKSDTATEISGCKVPIRLTLRDVKTGENPDKAEQQAPDTSESLNAAGKVAAKLDMSEGARARYDAAVQKMNSKDGKGCLAELDEHDKLDAKHQSTDPKSGIGHMRGQCLMLAGKCDAGKTLVRKSFEAGQGADMGADQIDRVVEGFASLHCQGSSMSSRDQLLKALQDLQQGAYMTKKDKAFCMSAYTTVKKLGPQVKPKDDEDTMVIHGVKNVYASAPACLARAGDCDAAWKVFQEAYPKDSLAQVKDQKTKDDIMRKTFETLVKKCQK
jgi:hypothetical protein